MIDQIMHISDTTVSEHCLQMFLSNDVMIIGTI